MKVNIEFINDFPSGFHAIKFDDLEKIYSSLYVLKSVFMHRNWAYAAICLMFMYVIIYTLFDYCENVDEM